MASYNPRSFTNPRLLKKIDASLLLRLLSGFDDYFLTRDFPLTERIDYADLAAILAEPTLETPEELSDALYFVHEMSTDSGMSALLEVVKSEGLAIDTTPDLTNADFAILVYLENPRLLERAHAERKLTHRRRFEHFRAPATSQVFKAPAKRILSRLESDLAEYFVDHMRGPFARVSVVSRDDETWFMIRHGRTFRREGTVEGQKASAIYFRPDKYDAAVYNKTRNELRINGQPQWIELYRQRFGYHLCNEIEYFCDESKYTLEPLRRDDERSLACVDVEGIKSIKLTEITYLWKGADPEFEIHRAKDLFANLRARGHELLTKPQLFEAKFRVKFSRFGQERTVGIRPPNIAQYVRDEDGPIVEEWLEKRGFVLKGKENGD